MGSFFIVGACIKMKMMSESHVLESAFVSMFYSSELMNLLGHMSGWPLESAHVF